LITRRNGEESIRDELTVCRWEEAYFGGNRGDTFFYYNIFSPLFLLPVGGVLFKSKLGKVKGIILGS